MGVCGDLSSDEMTIRTEGTAFSTMTKSHRASSHIEHNSSSDSPLVDDKERLLGTPKTNVLADFNKSVAQSSLSSSALSSQTEESMSSFDWAQNGIGFDGLERNTDKTREEIGMEALKAMEACGADVKRLSTHGGRTSLMFAVLSKDLRFVKQLVALRADVLKENDEGETALTLAKSLSTHDIYRFLQNVSADLY